MYETGVSIFLLQVIATTWSRNDSNSWQVLYVIFSNQNNKQLQGFFSLSTALLIKHICLRSFSQEVLLYVTKELLESISQSSILQHTILFVYVKNSKSTFTTWLTITSSFTKNRKTQSSIILLATEFQSDQTPNHSFVEPLG